MKIDSKALRVMAAVVCLVVLFSSFNASFALVPPETETERTARMEWWSEARLGMFIHWGLYAMAARHEWVKNYERITDEDYQKYFDMFDPDLYDPVAWARAAREAGMKYFVITTKHHEGFCLWDTEQTALCQMEPRQR